jgi:DNA anti-recombination protein RmuC
MISDQAIPTADREALPCPVQEPPTEVDMQDNRSQPHDILFGTGKVWLSDELLSEVQATLAALADLECSYEQDQERLRRASTTEAAAQHIRAELEKRHQQEREAYAQRLDQLEHRMQALTSRI